MKDREKWRERVRDIRASGTIWWWWVKKKERRVYNFGCFLCLTAHKPSWIILCQSNYFRRTAVMLFNPWLDKGVHTFPKCICTKVNVITRLEFELAYYESAVQRLNHYTRKTLSFIPLTDVVVRREYKCLSSKIEIWQPILLYLLI